MIKSIAIGAKKGDEKIYLFFIVNKSLFYIRFNQCCF